MICTGPLDDSITSDEQLDLRSVAEYSKPFALWSGLGPSEPSGCTETSAFANKSNNRLQFGLSTNFGADIFLKKENTMPYDSSSTRLLILCREWVKPMCDADA